MWIKSFWVRDGGKKNLCWTNSKKTGLISLWWSCFIEESQKDKYFLLWTWTLNFVLLQENCLSYTLTSVWHFLHQISQKHWNEDKRKDFVHSFKVVFAVKIFIGSHIKADEGSPDSCWSWKWQFLNTSEQTSSFVGWFRKQQQHLISETNQSQCNYRIIFTFTEWWDVNRTCDKGRSADFSVGLHEVEEKQQHTDTSTQASN